MKTTEKPMKVKGGGQKAGDTVNSLKGSEAHCHETGATGELGLT